MLRCKLPFGDYMASPPVVVDTKQDLEEITGNLCGSVKERERVIKEEKMAQEMDSKLIFLIEQEGITKPSDLIGLTIQLASHKKVEGEQLMQAMAVHEHKFGSEFVFCSPSEAGDIVKKILKEGT